MFVTVFAVIAEAKQMSLNNLPIHAVKDAGMLCGSTFLCWASPSCSSTNDLYMVQQYDNYFSGPSTVVDPVPVSVSIQLFWKKTFV